MLSLFPKRETVFLCENPIREIRDKKQEVSYLCTAAMFGPSTMLNYPPKTAQENWSQFHYPL